MSETVDRLLRRARSIRLAVTPTAALPRVPRRRRPKLRLRGALTALGAEHWTLTALLIHLFWLVAARHNVGDVVGQLNRQIVELIYHELHGVLDDASSMEEAVRSIFFQGTIKVTDEGSVSSSFWHCCARNRASRGFRWAFPTADFLAPAKPATPRST